MRTFTKMFASILCGSSPVCFMLGYKTHLWLKHFLQCVVTMQASDATKNFKGNHLWSASENLAGCPITLWLCGLSCGNHLSIVHGKKYHPNIDFTPYSFFTVTSKSSLYLLIVSKSGAKTNSLPVWSLWLLPSLHKRMAFLFFHRENTDDYNTKHFFIFCYISQAL